MALSINATWILRSPELLESGMNAVSEQSRFKIWSELTFDVRIETSAFESFSCKELDWNAQSNDDVVPSQPIVALADMKADHSIAFITSLKCRHIKRSCGYGLTAHRFSSRPIGHINVFWRTIFMPMNLNLPAPSVITPIVHLVKDTCHKW